MRGVFRYLQQKAFDELSLIERMVLQYEFDDLRPAAYRAALAGEVSIIFVSFPTGFVLLFLGLKVEL